MRTDSPRLSIPYACQTIEEDDVAAVVEVLRSDLVTQGPLIERFERALAEVTGAPEAVVVSSGTAALHLAMRSLLGEGPAVVFVPAITFAATANAARYCGAEVVFVDVDPATGLLDLEHLAACLERFSDASGQERLVAPVSFAGAMPDLEAIRDLAREHGAQVVEDAAHSLGGWRVDAQGGRSRSGSCEQTEAAILSFHPVKHICTGEGGAVLTQDPQLAQRLRTLRTHGIQRPHPEAGQPGYWYEEVELGYAYRMPDILAGLGLSQLEKLPRFLRRRNELAERYDWLLGEEPFRTHLETPQLVPGHAWHLYPVRFREAHQRDAAYAFLRREGIGVQVHYIPVYRQPVYAERYGAMRLPGAEDWFRRCLSLPLFPRLDDDGQDVVLQRLAAFFREA